MVDPKEAADIYIVNTCSVTNMAKTIVNGYLEGNTDWKAKEDARLITNLLSFTVPLLLVWGYDALRNRRRRKGKESE